MRKEHISFSNANQNRFDRNASAWRRLWNMRSCIVFAYLFRFAFASSLAWPFACRVDTSSYQYSIAAQKSEGQTILLVIESTQRLLATIHEQSVTTIGIVLFYLLLVPLVSMTWIYAIDEPCSFRTCVFTAVRRYHASLLISLFFLVALVTSIALFFGLGWLIHRGLWFMLNDRIRDALSFAVVLPASLLILYLAVSWDTARAGLLSNPKVSDAIKRGLDAAFHTTSIFAFLFWFGCAFLLSGGALLFVLQDKGFGQSFYCSFFLLETIAFLQTILRGRWLINARDIVQRFDKPSAHSASARES